jgi:Tol biopolymer transport system component
MRSRAWVGLLLVAACSDAAAPGANLLRNGPVVYMHRNPTAGNVDIWRIDPDGSNALQLTPSGQDHVWPALSSDGERVAYVSLDAPAGLYAMRIDGTDRRFLTSQVGDGSRLAWSPDSTRIAMAGYLAEGNGIAIVNADGTGYTQIGADSLGATSVAWSPDGRTLAFSTALGVSYGYQASIYRMNTDGSNITPIYVPTGDSGVLYPAWSPDGSHLAFAIGPMGSEMHIVVTNADGSDERAITSAPMCGDSTVYVNDINPSWSRDGGYLVFQRERGPQPCSGSAATGTDVYLVHASGFGLTQLTHDGTSFGPSW